MVDEIDSRFTTDLVSELTASVREPVLYTTILVSASQSGGATLRLGTRIIPVSLQHNAVSQLDVAIQLFEHEIRTCTWSFIVGNPQAIHFEMMGYMFPHHSA